MAFARALDRSWRSARRAASSVRPMVAGLVILAMSTLLNYLVRQGAPTIQHASKGEELPGQRPGRQARPLRGALLHRDWAYSALPSAATSSFTSEATPL